MTFAMTAAVTAAGAVAVVHKEPNGLGEKKEEIEYELT